MHSSRIRTVRYSRRLGGGSLPREGCLPMEGCLPRGMSAQWDVYMGGVCPGGKSDPPMDRMTDARENVYCSTVNVFVLCLSEFEMYFTL